MTELNQLIIASLAILPCLVAFFAVLGVLFPLKIHKSQSILEERLGRSFAIGLVNFLFFGAIALGLASIPEGALGGLPKLLALAFVVAPGLGAIVGLGGLVEIVGERIAPQSSGVSRTAWGVVLLALACALPFVGWFAMLPFALVSGLGAFILSLFARQA